MKEIIKLKNGITFISHQLKNTHSITVSVNFRVGSLYEDNNKNGITHLTEHLFFRKWDNLKQEELYQKMMIMGAEIIGKTYHDYVSFSITVVPEFFNEAFQLIIKCMNRFYWNYDDVEAEKKVVLKQIENDYQSYDKWVNSKYFKDTNYELPIMGTAKSVLSLSVQEINRWKDKYFCSHNSCIAVTGNYSDIDYLVMKQKISEINSFGQASKMMICKPADYNIRNEKNRYTVIDYESENSDITVFFDVPADFDYETVRLITGILGEGCGSILSMTMRETYNYTDDVYTDLMCYCGFYRISVSYNVSDIDFFESIKCMFETINNFKSNITQKDYLSSINFFTKNQLMDFDNQNTLNNRYVLCDFVLKSLISEPNELKEKYEQITINDLQYCADKLLTDKNISFLIGTSMDEVTVKEYIEKLIVKFL